MNNIRTISEIDCSGCGACYVACSMNCIDMIIDEEGFFHPEINQTRCVNCGKCLKVCTVNTIQKNRTLASFAAINKDKEITKHSSSGGMFPLLAKKWIREGGYVCGSLMRNNLSVEHVVIHTVDEIKLLQGSKYVQSNTTEATQTIDRILRDNGKVMFVGTPCQVSAIKNLFGSKYDSRLLLVDIICHGVPSQKFFKKHMNNNYWGKAGIANLTFRDKTPFEKSYYRFYIKSIMNNNIIVVPFQKDAYYNAFMKGWSYRESCYNCKYAAPDRVGDITIGDCATSDQYEQFPYATSLSTVIISTEKGYDYWKSLKDEVDFCDLDLKNEVLQNHQLNHPVKRTDKRDIIYKDFQNLSVVEFRNKYTDKISFRTNIKNVIKHLLPLSVKGKLKSMIKMGRM